MVHLLLASIQLTSVHYLFGAFSDHIWANDAKQNYYISLFKVILQFPYDYSDPRSTKVKVWFCSARSCTRHAQHLLSTTFFHFSPTLKYSLQKKPQNVSMSLQCQSLSLYFVSYTQYMLHFFLGIHSRVSKCCSSPCHSKNVKSNIR